MFEGIWGSALNHTFGRDALNGDRKGMEGSYCTRSPMWGALVGAELELVSITAEKVPKAQLVLAAPLLGPGVTRLPINLVRKLWGVSEILLSGHMDCVPSCGSADRRANRICFP